MIKEITNRKGEKFEIIVDDDFEHDGKIWLRKGYAYISVEGKEIALHRFIMKAPSHLKVDHRDNNKLNNKRENLRFYETDQENQANRKSKGYSYHKKSGKFLAQIKIDYKNVYLGLYETEEEAEKAYQKAHKEAFGEYSPH